MKPLFYIIISLVILLVLTTVVYETTFTEHVVEKTGELEFVLDYDYDTVRRVLVRTNSLEYLIEANGAKIVRSDWEHITLAFDRIIQMNWVVNATGNFDVRYQDPDMGSTLLPLRQTVHITKERMTVDVLLIEGTNYLQQYKTRIIIVPDGKKTRVRLEVFIGVSAKVPKTEEYFDYVEQQVQNSIESYLDNSSRAIRELISKYRNTRFIFRIN